MAKRKSDGGTALMEPPVDEKTAPDPDDVIPDDDDNDLDDDDSEGETADASPVESDPDDDRDDPPNPLNHAAELLAEIQEAQAEVDEAERNYLLAKERASDLKKIHEAKRSAVESLIHRSTEPQQPTPLFDGAKPHDGAVDQVDESWKEITLADAFPELRASEVQKFVDQELHTMGDLSAFMNSGRDVKDIDGVGEVLAQKVSDAFVAFWERRRQQTAPLADMAASIGETDEDAE